MEIPVGNKGIPPLLVAGHCDYSCDHRLNQLVFPFVEMPTVNRSRSHVVSGGAAFYYPGEDFRAWRAQFEALQEHEQWSDPVARQYACACMRDTAHDAVRDIMLANPGSLPQMLNAFEDWFQVLEDLVWHRMQRERLLPGPRRRRQPGGRKRRSLLKLRAKRGIMAPTSIPAVPPPGSSSRMISLGNLEGQLEEVTLPPTREDLRMQTMIKRTRAFLQNEGASLLTPSTEDVRNRLVHIHPQRRSQESRDPLVPTPRTTPPRHRAGPGQERNETDFPSGQ